MTAKRQHRRMRRAAEQIVQADALADVVNAAIAELEGFYLMDDDRDGNPPEDLKARQTTPALLKMHIMVRVRQRLDEESVRRFESVVIRRDRKDPQRLHFEFPARPTVPPPDRLFVPLTSEAFGWWLYHGKRRELRVYGKRWNRANVYPGRRVELRKGYSDASLWGWVGRVTVCAFEHLTGNGVAMEEIAPSGTPWIHIRDLIGGCSWKEHVIAFEVDLDAGQGVGG